MSQLSEKTLRSVRKLGAALDANTTCDNLGDAQRTSEKKSCGTVNRHAQRVQRRRSTMTLFAFVLVIVIVLGFTSLLTARRGAKVGHFNDDDDDNSHTCTAVTTMGMTDAKGEIMCGGVMFRGSDGSDHGVNKWFGAEGTIFGRYVSPGEYTTTYDERNRPNARALSNALCAQVVAETPKHKTFSSLMWSFGQFVDHMIAMSPGECGASASKIRVSMDGDPHFDPNNEGVELVTDTTHYLEEPVGHRHPVNINSHFIDGSAVYGSTSGRHQSLREYRSGLLRTQQFKEQSGEYPPYNTAGHENFGGRRNRTMFLFGDIRANEQIPLNAQHTLFMREHNYQARRIADANPTWNDECIFQQARKIVVGILQRIIFNEFVPTLIGETLPPAKYSETTDPRIYVEFSTAAFRFHTLVNDLILRVDPVSGQQHKQPLPLREGFGNPEQLIRDGIDEILLGLLKQNSESVDLKIVDDLRNFLFFKDGEPLDLTVLNIVRGREHGIPDFSTLREHFGLGKLRSWADLTSDLSVRSALEQAYGAGGYKNLDAWIGLFVEDKPADRPLGHTLTELVRDQFVRLRDGDPHYYEFDPFVSEVDRAYIEQNGSFRQVLLRNTQIASHLVQPDPFLFVASDL